jgi:hypothetical protein
MDALVLRESTTDAIRYWEPRRLAYNAVLAAIVVAYFGFCYPASKGALSIDKGLLLFVLAVLANVAYCTAYVVDIFAQASGYRERWLKYRWVLFSIGTLFAGVITRSFALGLFGVSQ